MVRFATSWYKAEYKGRTVTLATPKMRRLRRITPSSRLNLESTFCKTVVLHYWCYCIEHRLCTQLMEHNMHVYVPRFLAICAISKLRCAFCQLPNCVPISKLRTRFQNCATRLLRNLEMEMSEQDTPALDSSDHTFLQWMKGEKLCWAERDRW